MFNVYLAFLFFPVPHFPNVTHLFIKYTVCEAESFVFHSQPAIVCYFLRRLLLSFGENDKPTM